MSGGISVKTTTYPSISTGDAGSSGTRQVVSSNTIMNPWLMRSYRCTCATSEGVQPCSAIVREGEATLSEPHKFLLFLSLSLYLPLFSGVAKEVRRQQEFVRENLGVPLGVTTEEAKR
jgi:hypothetical protein